VWGVWGNTVGICGWKMKIVLLGAFPIHLFRHFYCKMYRLATIYFVTDRWTDRRQYHANRWSYCVTTWSAKMTQHKLTNYTSNQSIILSQCLWCLLAESLCSLVTETCIFQRRENYSTYIYYIHMICQYSHQILKANYSEFFYFRIMKQFIYNLRVNLRT